MTHEISIESTEDRRFTRWINSILKKFKNKRCPICRHRLFVDTNNTVNYDLHCANCQLHFASRWTGMTYNDWGVRECRSLKDTAKKTTHIIDGRSSLYRFDRHNAHPSPEQAELEQKLKDERQSSIIPTKEFHDIFCKVMREESHRECKCYGEDLKL